jgi:hypothetical protein
LDVQSYSNPERGKENNGWLSEALENAEERGEEVYAFTLTPMGFMELLPDLLGK